MKRIQISIFVIIITLLVGCVNKTEDRGAEAEKYDKKIMSLIRPVVAEMNSLFGLMPAMVGNSIQGTLSDKDVELVNAKFKSINASIENSMDSLCSMDEFDQEIRYKAEAINYLTVSKSTVNNEVVELATRVQQPMENENIIRSGDIIILVSERLVKLEKSMLKVRSKFACKYSIDKVEVPNNMEEVEQQIINYKEELEKLRMYH